MRIAYITIHIAPEIMQGGVGNKINNQISIWRERGHEVTLFSLTPAEFRFPVARQFVFGVHSKFKVFRMIEREIKRSAVLKRMLSSIREYNPDLIYLRFGLYSYPLHLLFGMAPVILETNSNDMVEYAGRGILYYWLNRLTRNLTFGPASGLVLPAHELVDVLLPKRDKPFCVISNGINLNDVEILPSAKNTSPVITLVGSPGMNWHGVDKLISFAERYPDLTVNIVGYSRKDVNHPIPENARLHGFLDRQALREVLSKSDVTCGTLALHRKNMNEASPLKVRESLMYGIPVILAYHDTDLAEMNIDTILYIPNTEENVMQNAERIRKFAFDMMGRRVDINSIAPHLDQHRKEEIRLTFFQQVLEGRRV